MEHFKISTAVNFGEKKNGEFFFPGKNPGFKNSGNGNSGNF